MDSFVVAKFFGPPRVVLHYAVLVGTAFVVSWHNTLIRGQQTG